MADTRKIAVHGHYYQPPRGNPFLKQPLKEPTAAPYENWNEKVTAECYTPNAEIGNFDLVSFNVGETLAAWLEKNVPDTYERIRQADAGHKQEFGVGNAIAQPMHHTILPLARREEKVTQVAWGLKVFQYRFGHESKGIWLPEMAVDMEALEVLVEQGVEWTILTERQVTGDLQGSGPYRIKLSDGRSIRVFLRDERLSNDIAFNLGHFGGAGRWAREVLHPRLEAAGELTLIATDGETFGHHWPGEEQFLHWLLTYEAHAAGYEVTTLARYLEEADDLGDLELRPFTSWSCEHGVARWLTGCGCTPGDSSWKGAMRRALDNLRSEVDGIYEDATDDLDGVDAARLRDDYIKVVLGHVARDEYLQEQEIDVNGDAAERLLKLVEAQFYRQRMYASCAFFFSDLDELTSRYGIANAAYAIYLTREATGDDLSGNFRYDLAVAKGQDRKTKKAITGADLFDEIYSSLDQ